MDRRGNPETKSQPRQNAKRPKKQKKNRLASKKALVANEGRLAERRLTFQYPDVSPQAAALGGKLAQYARQAMLPNEVAKPIPLPDQGESQVAVRTVRRNFVLTSENISASGSAVVVVPPDILAPAYITNPGGVLIPAAPGRLYMEVSHFTSVGTSDGSLNNVAQVHDAADSEKAKATTIPITLNGVQHYGFPVHSVAAATCQAVVMRVKGSTVIYRLAVAYGTAAGWTWPGPMTSNMSSGVQQTINFTLPAGCLAFAFVVMNSDGVAIEYDRDHYEYPFEVSVSLGTGNDAVQYVGGGTSSIAKGFDNYVLDNTITRGRVTAVSVLATNTSAALNKQGQIFAARCEPRGLTRLADMDTYIRGLAGNRQYIGAAEYGAYVWWYPKNQLSQSVLPIESAIDTLRTDDLLLLYFKGLNPGAGLTTFNLQFTYTVEIFSPSNQAFEKLDTPAVTPEYQMLQQMLAAMPCASCNPAHEDIFRRIVDKARSLHGHYQENKAVYDSLAAILMKAVGQLVA